MSKYMQRVLFHTQMNQLRKMVITEGSGSSLATPQSTRVPITP